LHNLLKFTINSFDYLVEKALEDVDSETPEGKLSIIQSLAPFIGKVDSNVRRESMIRMLSDVLEIDFRSIEADLRKIGKDPVPEKGIGIVRKPITVSLELYLMMAVAANREQFSYVRGKIQLNDLVDSSARALYIYLEDSFRTGKNEGDSAFLDRIEEEDLKQLFTRKLVSGEFEVNPGNVIRQSLLRVKRESLIRSRTNLERELSRMKTKEVDSKIIEQLLADKMFIDVELGKLREASNDGNTE
jgi:DNA primase